MLTVLEFLVDPSKIEAVHRVEAAIECVGVKMRRHMVSRKDLLDGAGDPLGFNAGITDPAYSSRDMPIDLTLQLTRRESLSVI